MAANRLPPVAPYLTVAGAAAAIAFYERAFDAVELGRTAAEDGARIRHAALRINGGLVMLSDDFPEFNGGVSRAPAPGRHSGVTIHLDVPDTDAAFARAIAAGAAPLDAPADMFWGDRYARLRDPFGHEWSLGAPTRPDAA
jgi:PhnB protein